ncbi:MAG: c-type cytochrome [Gammaproteobacteria bacterium]|nr:c-type cytochrome [Gammaproteobacteria bacterium]
MKIVLKTSLFAAGLLAALQVGPVSAQQYSTLDLTSQSIGNKVCATCHGAYGQGNPAVGGPSLAGLEPWYLRSQLEKFRAGWRGAEPSYIPAHEMRAAVSQISNAEIELLVDEIADWPEPEPEAYLEGSAEDGEALYAACAACHGRAGEGNQALQAPALADRDGWYLYRQLNLFKSGYRGGHPEDTVGAQMRASARALPDDQSVKDVVAYINSLN